MTHESNPSLPNPSLGQSHTRVEGPSKVTGQARYETDVHLPGLAYAALVRAPTCGQLAGLDLDTARAMPGVLDILTHETVGDAIRQVKASSAGGYANSTWRPLGSSTVAYPGQVVALVVADSGEAASAAADAVVVHLVPHPGTFRLGTDPGQPVTTLKPHHKDERIGDVEAGLAAAAARIEATYETPVQHHNPMELFASTCVWDGDQLTVHEPARFVCGLQHGLAEQLGMPADKVRVISRLVGGHFGSRLNLSQQTALVALVAKRLARPVKLVATRSDGFTIATYRPESRHEIKLAADADGRLTAFSHVATVPSSRFDDFTMQGVEVTSSIYACPNVATQERFARVDRNTPGPMRAPPEVPYLFALESAMDELAWALKLDPIELRRRNDTKIDPMTGNRYTTRRLMACFDKAAADFGWDRARPVPGSRRDGDWLVGAGCASSMRPTKIGPAAIRVGLTADGGALVETAHHEIGNGITTLLAARAVEKLGVPMTRVRVALGDTRLPPAGISGGSSTTTSLIPALDEACAKLREQVAAAHARNDPTLQSVTVQHLPEGIGPAAIDKLDTGHAQLGQVTGKRYAAAFGAHFAEVRVHARTREIRVSRLVGAFAAGRILNPLTAHSQLIGGMIWGLGAALLEATEIDPATGGYTNSNLADYLVATSADVPSVKASFVEDEDNEVNPAGVKGLGEIAIIGANAAIANAVYAATGKRIRRLPIRVEDLLA